MKKPTLTLPILLLIAGTISLSYGQVPIKKYANAGENLREASNDIDVTKDLKEIPQNLYSEYQNFKNISEIRIHNNEKVFAEFKRIILNNNRIDITTFQKMVNQFEQENTDLKNELFYYKINEGPIKWKSFKRAFKHDMDVLGVQMWSVN